MIIVRNRLTGLLLPGKFPAVCIWPFILVRPDEKMTDLLMIIRHESIHARQQLEMAWIFFFIWYMLEFGIRWMVLRNFMKAYQHLSHEKEAHLHHNDTGYLKRRRPYSWLKYL